VIKEDGTPPVFENRLMQLQNLKIHLFVKTNNEYFMRIIQKENKLAYLYLEINLP
jgi:hypothetical protein